MNYFLESWGAILKHTLHDFVSLTCCLHSLNTGLWAKQRVGVLNKGTLSHQTILFKIHAVEYFDGIDTPDVQVRVNLSQTGVGIAQSTEQI